MFEAMLLAGTFSGAGFGPSISSNSLWGSGSSSGSIRCDLRVLRGALGGSRQASDLERFFGVEYWLVATLNDGIFEKSTDFDRPSA
jgi:hypothetical protein